MAPTKKLTPQQQKEKREKIILAVLVGVLVVVGAIQGPKLMGGSSGASSTPPASTTAAGTASLTATPVAAAPAGGSQLSRLGSFSTKDPFKSQVKLSAPGTTPAAAPSATVSKSAAKTGKKGVSPVTLAVTPAPKNLVPEGPQVPAALLLVNGKKTVVPLNGTFPKKNPLFQLVSISPKEIELKLVGGSLTGGDTTFKLLKGHPLRLVNQTAGTKFVLAMIKPTTAPKPAAPTVTTTTPTTTAPASTTTSTTPAIPPTTTTG